MANYTPTQGRYLAYINFYRQKRGISPSEAEIATAMYVAPPSVNQMIKNLEKRGLISRQPGVPRSVRIIIPDDEVPTMGRNGVVIPAAKAPSSINAPEPSTTNLYVLYVYIYSGPLSSKYIGKECSRFIEICGNQTLDDLHKAIFNAYDREKDRPYEFQLGRKANDPKGPNYRVNLRGLSRSERVVYHAKKATLDDLSLELHRTFGYAFDFTDCWFHHVQVEKIETAIPTVTYPRVISRKGKSPPQYEKSS